MAAKAIKHALAGVHRKGRRFLSVKRATAPVVLAFLFQRHITGDFFLKKSFLMLASIL